MASSSENLKKRVEKQLAQSPTALGSGTTPTSKDISLARQLESIKTRETGEKNAILQAQWYSDEQANTKKKATNANDLVVRTEPKGVLKRGLQALGIPLYSIVGATEAALGKGTEKGLYSNIKSNVEEQGTFGDILRQYGATGAGAFAGGLALDIALDPVNWVTMGAEALIPRIAYGAGKAGTKGLALGAKSAALDVAKTVTKPLDWIGLAPKAKAAKTVVTEAAGLSGDAAKAVKESYNLRGSIVNAAKEAKTSYNDITGRTMEKLLASRGAIGDIAENAPGVIRPYIVPSASTQGALDKMVDFFTYSPQKWFRSAVDKAIEYQKQGGTVENWTKYQTGKGALIKTREDIAKEAKSMLKEPFEQITPSGEKLVTQEIASAPFGKFREQLGQTLEKMQPNVPTRYTEHREEIRNELKAMLQGPEKYAEVRTANSAKEGAEMAIENPQGAILWDHDARAKAFSDEALDGLAMEMAAKKLKEAGMDVETQAGILKQLRESKKEATGFAAFDKLAQKFSDMWIVKDKVKGEQIIRGYKTFIDAFKGTKIGQLSSSMLAYLNNAAMTQMYGIRITPEFIKEVKNAAVASISTMGSKGAIATESLLKWAKNPEIQKLAREYPEIFFNTFKVRPDVVAQSETAMYEIMSKFQEANGAAQISKEEFRAMQKQFAENLRKKGLLLEAGESTFISRELDSGSYMKGWMKSLEEMSDTNPLAKAVHWFYNKPIEFFETSDQAYKMGLTLHLIKNGLTDSELLTVNRFNPVQLGVDIFKDAKTGKYKFSGLKAADIANDVYMNYAAMPGAVKVLRSMPLFGMPFASFMYAMLTKTGQTALYNPSFFNKVQFMLNELNGGRSPIEKLALNQPYYQWMRENGMVSIPFFRDSPVYMNMSSFFPYMTMNIFEPSERRTEKTLGGTITKMIDSMPILKTPEGQVLMDYFIVPALLRDTNPTGIFDQPLYPADASAGTKAAYFARSMGETIFPSNLAALGVVTPEAALPYMPSYKYRKLGYAAKGKSPLGLTTKESRVSATVRALIGAYSGVGLYPLKTQYVK